MKSTKNYILATAILIYSTNIAISMENNDLENCKTAFNDMIKNNGSNLWWPNINDHCEDEVKKEKKSCFSCKKGALIQHLKNSECQQFQALGKVKENQKACQATCGKDIGKEGLKGEDTKKIYFTTQPANNETKQKSKWMIFNLYPEK